MNNPLFFHADRSLCLKPSMVLDRISDCQTGIISACAPFIQPDFKEHLVKLCENGLSYHGRQYTIQQKQYGGFPANDLIREIMFEYYRWKLFKDKPSRFQSFYSCNNPTEAYNFAIRTGAANFAIYEIEALSDIHCADMNALGVSMDNEENERLANIYWQGEPLSQEYSYVPTWEYVIKLPVRVIREVKLTPFHA